MTIIRIVVVIACFSWAGSASAGLIGQSVGASMEPFPGAKFSDLTISTQFPSPAIVGAGVEFTGKLGFDGLGLEDQFLEVLVDVFDDGFQLSFGDAFGFSGFLAGFGGWT